jgi:hypothetical protein
MFGDHVTAVVVAFVLLVGVVTSAAGQKLLFKPHQEESESDDLPSFGGSGAFTQKCMKCICNVESGCNPNIGCVPDQGSDSCGAYQIKNAYWIDCGQPGGSWKACANDLSCAEGCVKAYMRRYGTYCTGGTPPTCEDYSRIHNGGPKGCQKSSTLGYWAKVKQCCGSQTGCD